VAVNTAQVTRLLRKPLLPLLPNRFLPRMDTAVGLHQWWYGTRVGLQEKAILFLFVDRSASAPL